MADNMTDDLIISISTDQATLRRSIKRIEQDLGTLAGTVKKQFDTVGKSIDSSVSTTMQNRINAMVGIGKKGAEEWTGALADQGKELDRLRAKYSPLFNTINNYKTAVADIRRAHAVGAISANEMAAAISKERQAALASTAAIKGRNAALSDAPTGRSGGPSPYTSNIAAQFQDIGVTAFGGMSPLQIALQQGTQLSAVFNDLKRDGQGVGAALVSAFASVVSPVSLVTIGLVAGSAALLQYFTSLGGGAEEAKDVLKDHAALISRIKGAYGEASEGLEEYTRESRKIVDQATTDKIKDYRKSIADVAQELRAGLTKLEPRDFKGATFTIGEVVSSLKMLEAGIKSGNPDLQAFVEKLIEIENQSGTPENIRKILSELRSTAGAGVEAQRALKPLEDTIDGVGAAAARQARQISGLTKALGDLADIAKPSLSDAEKVEEAYRRAISNSSNREDRDDAFRARQDALDRLDRQDPTVVNSDGRTVAVPTPTARPNRELEFLPGEESAGKKQETAAEKLKNAYRDLMKSADDRLGQMQQEIELLGKFGVEAEAARFKLDLLQASEDKGRSLSEEQRKELEKKVALYRQYAETLAKAKLSQDLLDERRFKSLSKTDQAVFESLRQYGLPTDLNSEEANKIRQAVQTNDMSDGIKSFFTDFSSALQQNGGDIGEAFATSIKNAAMNAMNKALDDLFSKLAEGLASAFFGGGKSGTSGVPGLDLGVVGSVFSGGASTSSRSVSSTGNAVDLASKLIGANENTSTSQINSFLKAGGVDINAAQTKWCAAFVNSSLEQIGVKGSGSLTANSFQNWGSQIDLSDVMKGDVLLQTRGLGANQAGGHVGFATGATRMFEGQKQLQMLSGNSSDAVSQTWVNAAELQARRATEAAGALAKVADSSGVAVTGLGKIGQMSTSFFPSAPAAPAGGGGGFMSWLGGLFSPDLSAYKGKVGLFASGGVIQGPGSGTSDSIPTMLSDEEFIVNARQSKKHRALLHAINNGTLGHMAIGGVVSRVSVPVAPTVRSRGAAANDNGQPGILQVHISGASGDDHVRMLVRQGVGEGISQYNKSQERGGFGTVQSRFTSQKG